MAKSEGKTLSAIIQDALREARARRRQGEFGALQQFWSERAKELGILTEEDRATSWIVKVVFDTNILVSGFTLPGGRGDRALRRVIQGADTLAISKPIINELVGVLAHKFEQDREQLARTAVLLADLAEVVDPRNRLSVLDDVPDNRIIEVRDRSGSGADRYRISRHA